MPHIQYTPERDDMTARWPIYQALLLGFLILVVSVLVSFVMTTSVPRDQLTSVYTERLKTSRFWALAMYFYCSLAIRLYLTSWRALVGIRMIANSYFG
jgi:hypothetical protein